MVGIHIVASAAVGKIEFRRHAPTCSGASAGRKGMRPVDFAMEGVHDTDIYNAELLEAGMEFAGPAIIEDSSSAVVMRPGDKAAIDCYGNIEICAFH